MAYEKSLDKELFSEEVRFDKVKLKVGVYSYDGAESKVQISRMIFDEEMNGFKFLKLGRLTKAELELLLPVLDKARNIIK